MLFLLLFLLPSPSDFYTGLKRLWLVLTPPPFPRWFLACSTATPLLPKWMYHSISTHSLYSWPLQPINSQFSSGHPAHMSRWPIFNALCSLLLCQLLWLSQSVVEVSDTFYRDIQPVRSQTSRWTRGSEKSREEMLIFGRRERHEVISILVEVTRCLSVAGRVRCINSKVAQGWRRHGSILQETLKLWRGNKHFALI